MRTDTKNEKRARGRPRSFVEDEVLERVRAVFTEKGYSAASLDDLAAASGLNRPSLYAAFGNKEQLYVRLIRHMSERSVAGIELAMSSAGTLEERLVRLYRHAIRGYTAPPRPPGCMIVGTATAEAPTHPAIAEAAAAFIAANEAALERHFAAATQRGELAAAPTPAARARLAGALFDTLAIRARLGTEAADLETFARSTIPLISAQCPVG
jgi:AcrR family transcriptional regulator